MAPLIGCGVHAEHLRLRIDLSPESCMISLYLSSIVLCRVNCGW